MVEKPAEGVKGFLLYDPHRDKYFFRVYGDVDPETGRKKFTDYEIYAEEIAVTIESRYVSLFEREPGNADEDGVDNQINWSNKTRGKGKEIMRNRKAGKE